MTASTLYIVALNTPATDEMKDEHDHRHDQHDVDETAGDVQGKAAHPQDEEDDSNGQEQARRSRPRISLASQFSGMLPILV